MKNSYKVLIITYYWPPAGGPGVQRWLKFVKYFGKFNIEPVVYVPENPFYPIRDNSLINEIPDDIKILKQPIKEPYKLASLISKNQTKSLSSGIIPEKKQTFIEKLLLWVRGNLFIPDARVGWMNPSVKFLKKYLKENPIDLVITTGPPHSLHLIGLGLKKDLNIKWLSDFRDPWTTIGYHSKLKLSKQAQRKHKILEANVLQTADKILVTSPTTKKQFETITNKEIVVVTNGFDREISNESRLDDKFTISHFGSLLTERNPELLWKVLSEIIEEDQQFSNDLKIQLAGVVSEGVIKSIEKFNLKTNLSHLGYLPHSAITSLQNKSQILLLLEIDRIETRAIIPGKLFEYLAAKRPILALGPRDSDIAPIIEETNSGIFLNYSQENELKSTIKNYYRDFKKNNLRVNSTKIENYSRKYLTKQLSEVIKSM